MIKLIFDVKLLDKLSINDQTISFPHYVNDYFSLYIEFLRNIKPKFNLDDSLINSIIKFNKNIFSCLLEYYSGQHYAAYDFFKDAVKNINFSQICIELDDKKFYRGRVTDGCKVDAKEIFHIPFEKRYLVDTQRFSYPGLPCLYLGSSYHLCNEEVGEIDKKLNIGIFKKSSLKIPIIDLFFFEKYDFEKMTMCELTKLLLLWPLVACCSFFYVNTKDMKFRPDYILPQLLLEFIIDKNASYDVYGVEQKIYGIKYCSVKKLQNYIIKNDSKYSCINYVFPALNNIHNKGHCKDLEKFFEIDGIYFLEEIDQIDSQH